MRPIWTQTLVTFLLLVCLAAGRVYCQTPQIGQNLASLVYLDGKNVIENAQFAVHREQFLSLETYDLLPNSSVELTTQQNGLPLEKKTYHTNDRGSMKDILFFPKAKSSIRCVLRFSTQNGEEKRVVFHLKPI
ncbi:MAG: hypothetical protein U0176_01860 [Bacteroidia bacterium]